MDDWQNWDDDGDDLAGVSCKVADVAISGNGITTSMAPSPTCKGSVEVVDSTIAGRSYGPRSQTRPAAYVHVSEGGRRHCAKSCPAGK